MDPSPELRIVTTGTGRRLSIRTAVEADVELIDAFVTGLAEYEQLLHLKTATAEDLRQGLFGPRARAEALIAELDSRPAGMALFFPTFSTFKGQPGLYLEDLFVDPEFRGEGVGRALLARLAAIAVERGCFRLEWSVLDWNRGAIDFYRRLGADPAAGWTVYHLSGSALERLAAEATVGGHLRIEET